MRKFVWAISLALLLLGIPPARSEPALAEGRTEGTVAPGTPVAYSLTAFAGMQISIRLEGEVVGDIYDDQGTWIDHVEPLFAWEGTYVPLGSDWTLRISSKAAAGQPVPYALEVDASPIAYERFARIDAAHMLEVWAPPGAHVLVEVRVVQGDYAWGIWDAHRLGSGFGWSGFASNGIQTSRDGSIYVFQDSIALPDIPKTQIMGGFAKSSLSGIGEGWVRSVVVPSTIALVTVSGDSSDIQVALAHLPDEVEWSGEGPDAVAAQLPALRLSTGGRTTFDVDERFFGFFVGAATMRSPSGVDHSWTESAFFNGLAEGAWNVTYAPDANAGLKLIGVRAPATLGLGDVLSCDPMFDGAACFD